MRFRRSEKDPNSNDVGPPKTRNEKAADLPPHREPLGWNTRMKIAADAAKGLVYLHDRSNPQVIHRDMKSANILLDNEFNAKLSDFGMAKFGPIGDDTHVSTRVLGTYGYCAPEYAMTGQLNAKSDVYGFGVVLLELITGRMAYDESAHPRKVVTWAMPFLNDRREYVHLADPLLQGRFPEQPFYQAVEIASMCIGEEAGDRPSMRDVLVALEFVASHPYVP